MIDDETHRGRRSSFRPLLAILVLGMLAAALVLLGPGLLSGLRTEGGALLGAPECMVDTSEGQVELDRAEAKLATTAVALRARGMEAPDTSGIDEAALQALADGPSDDAGPVLSCRGSATSDLTEEQLTGSGLTPRAEQVRGAMTEVFGDQSLGGFAPGGVGQGHGADSTWLGPRVGVR